MRTSLILLATIGITACGNGNPASSPELGAAVDAAVPDFTSLDLAGADLVAPPDLFVFVDSAADATADEKACDRLCARDKQLCMNPNSDFCSAACADTIGRIRKAAAAVFIACVENLACGANSQPCLAEAAEKTRRPADDTYQAACLARRTECANSFSDSYCRVSALFEDAVVAALNACLAKPCADVATCLRVNAG